MQRTFLLSTYTSSFKDFIRLSLLSRCCPYAALSPLFVPRIHINGNESIQIIRYHIHISQENFELSRFASNQNISSIIFFRHNFIFAIFNYIWVTMRIAIHWKRIKSSAVVSFWGPSDLDISIYSDSVTSQRETTTMCGICLHSVRTLSGFVPTVSTLLCTSRPCCFTIFFHCTLMEDWETIYIQPNSYVEVAILGQNAIKLIIFWMVYLIISNFDCHLLSS